MHPKGRKECSSVRIIRRPASEVGATTKRKEHMQGKIIKVRITYTEELLGTAADPEVHREFIASKSPDAKSLEEEVAAVGAAAVDEKSRTRFAVDKDGCEILFDYQIKGFFKDACGMLSRVEGTKSNKLKAYKKVIDGLIFPHPREIKIVKKDGAKPGVCERPLRANTAQGERVALASSVTMPVESVIEFEVELLDPGHEELLTEWFEYGRLRGMGQWRNSGKGRFSYEYV